jgi:competence protein ComEC
VNRVHAGVVVIQAVLACSRPPIATTDSGASTAAVTTSAAPLTAGTDTLVPATPKEECGAGQHMTVHFYDVGQGLAVLVDLPNGRHVLLDTGDSPKRRHCGPECATANEHLLGKLRNDLHGAPIDLAWITHQHSDHIGGAPEVFGAFKVGTYVDNGRDTRRSEVRRAHEAAVADGATIRVVDPEHLDVPMPSSAELKLTAVVPPVWPPSCSHDPNECSIGLRIDFCASSVLVTGDAEHDEEAHLDPHGTVTVLQVAHHGSETSTTPAFLGKAQPKYAVISAGKPGEGMNSDYCHPRAIIVKRLMRLLGGPGSRTLTAFDGERCDRATPSDWVEVPTNERLWATERDGDVVLTTTGDGAFVRE